MKQTATKIVLTALLCVGAFTLSAQVPAGDSTEIKKDAAGRIYFARIRPSQSGTLKEAPKFLHSFLKARPEHEFRLTRETTDQLGITHQRYAQYFQGIKIENAEYLVHGNKGIIQTINGDYNDISVPSVAPVIKEADALPYALAFVKAKKYKWEDSGLEKWLKEQKNDVHASFYPKGELVIARDALQGSGTWKLAWKFIISSLAPANEQMIYVDASNGNIIDRVSLVHDGNSPSTADTRYSGNLPFVTDTYAGGFRLQETRNGVNIQTLNLQNTYDYPNAIDFNNTSANWTFGNWNTIGADQPALDVHWGAENVLDYWRTVHGRNSIDGNGLRALSYVHAGAAWNNAQWVGGGNANFMQYGDGDNFTFKPLVALDICAHELGHGICQFTVNLTNSNSETGALNEGLSDIWGACIEHWAAPGKQTWLVGEEVMGAATGAICLRSLRNPKAESWAAESANTHGHPDTYLGQFWDNTGINDVSAHTNSTVLSHWFYLLSVGGTGTNDVHNNYHVTGIGIDEAQRIVYRMESVYMSAGSTFLTTRSAAIEAARDLYGLNSCEEESVANAWYAVGVGNAYVSTYGSLIINGPVALCNNSTQTYTVTNVPAKAKVTWSSTSSFLTIVPAADGLSATVTNNGGSSSANVIATFGGCSGLGMTAKIIQLGAPGTVGIASYSNLTYCDYNDFAILAGGGTRYPISGQLGVSAFGATSYTWTRPGTGGTFIFWSDLGGGMVSVSSKGSNGSLELNVRAANGCGFTNGSYYFQPLICNVARMITPGSDPNASTADPSLAVYPNPVTSQLTITLTNEVVAGGASIRITDVYGRLVRRLDGVSNKTTTSVAALADGVYIVEVYAGNKVVMTKKIVKN